MVLPVSELKSSNGEDEVNGRRWWSMVVIEYFNERLKKFSIFDVKLAQGAAIFLALTIVKVFPQIMEIHVSWFVALTILCALRPLYVMFLKK